MNGTATLTRRRSKASRLVTAAKSPLSGRITFPLVCLLVWLLALEVVQSIWPFAVDVLPKPMQVFEFMWDEVTGDTLAPYNLYETFGISLKRLGIGMAIAMAVGTVILLVALLDDLVLELLGRRREPDAAAEAVRSE